MSNTVCPVRRKCGGCQLSNLTYPEQLKLKEKYVTSLVGKFGRVSPIIAADNPYHYRAKVQAAFGTTRGGKIISGVYQSSSHTIVNIDSCLIEDERADAIIVTVRRLINSFKLSVYDENSGKGFLRHVLVRCGRVSGEVMVVLVTGTPSFPKKTDFLRILLKEHPYITTVVQSINGGFTSLVLGKSENVLFGKGYIEDTLCSLRFRISPRSFYQVNPEQTEKLYGAAMEFAALTGKERVIDAYCGTGTIGLIASKGAREVIGAEINEQAVEDARANAKLNGVENASFICRDAGEFMLELAENGEKADVVFLDPPRAGSDQRFLTSLLRLAPNKIVYISCKPETLARDIRTLTDGGYRVRKIQPVDMFPHTRHTECVVMLTKPSPAAGQKERRSEQGKTYKKSAPAAGQKERRSEQGKAYKKSAPAAGQKEGRSEQGKAYKKSAPAAGQKERRSEQGKAYKKSSSPAGQKERRPEQGKTYNKQSKKTDN